jgi:hypothetical protein
MPRPAILRGRPGLADIRLHWGELAVSNPLTGEINRFILAN